MKAERFHVLVQARIAGRVVLRKPSSNQAMAVFHAAGCVRRLS